MLWVYFSPVYAQQFKLDTLLSRFSEYRVNNIQEKLYVHTDRDFYLTGENIWFKIYCVDGNTHQLLDMSKVAYLEIIDKDKNPVLQVKVGLKEGQGDGSLFLPASLNSGNYLIRAYTNWMKNYDPGYFFRQPVKIVNTFKTLGIEENKADKDPFSIEFFPEGGNLVYGMNSKVAFRAIDQNGKGINFRGMMLSQRGDTLFDFNPDKLGIGSFMFTPQDTCKYKALITYEEDTMLFPLPEIFEEGYVTHLSETGNDKLKIELKSRLSSVEDQFQYMYLVVHSRHNIKFAEAKKLKSGETDFVVDKSILSDGISHFTVFNGNQQPVCERLYYKKPENKLNISVKTDKQVYTGRNKVNLSLQARSEINEPQIADLSLSIYLVDSLNLNQQVNIESYLMLSSDLNGTVESPGYYVSDKATSKDIDNLMLTHGWRRFRWDEVLDQKNKLLKFVPEFNGHIINGKIVDRKGSPAAGIVTYLSVPGKIIRLFGSRSDSKGRIKFEVQDFYDQSELVVQTNTKQDTSYRIEIFSPFSDHYSGYKLPEFDLSPGNTEEVLDRSVNMQVQNVYSKGSTMNYILPEIDSTAFYGEPDSRFLLDEYTRFTTMEDVMREYVANVWVKKRRGDFYFMVYDEINESAFVNESMVLLDGVPVFDVNKIMDFDPLKVESLDLVKKEYYLGPLTFNGILSYRTYEGDLSGFQLDPRSLILEYKGLELQREFYSPRYESQDHKNSRHPDFRNLLYWDPDIKIDNTGETNLDFFTSDQNGTYLIVVQGLTKDGVPGSSKEVRIKVKNEVN